MSTARRAVSRYIERDRSSGLTGRAGVLRFTGWLNVHGRLIGIQGIDSRASSFVSDHRGSNSQAIDFESVKVYPIFTVKIENPGKSNT
jgi:hypothetical protein